MTATTMRTRHRGRNASSAGRGSALLLLALSLATGALADDGSAYYEELSSYTQCRQSVISARSVATNTESGSHRFPTECGLLFPGR